MGFDYSFSVRRIYKVKSINFLNEQPLFRTKPHKSNHWNIQYHSNQPKKKTSSLNIWPQLNELMVEWEKNRPKYLFFQMGMGKNDVQLKKFKVICKKKKSTHERVSSHCSLLIHTPVRCTPISYWIKSRWLKKIWLIYFGSSDLPNSFFCCSPSPE